MIGFYIRPDDWRQEKAYWDEIQAEEDRANEATEERKRMDKEIDEAWKKVHEIIDREAFKHNLSYLEVYIVWELGLKAWDAMNTKAKNAVDISTSKE